MRRDYYPVSVVGYDSFWPQRYLEAAEQIAHIFQSELLAIHHIGGTSIPYMCAKPIIDILPVVKDIDVVEEYHGPLGDLGYRPRGEYGIEGRRYFIRADEDVHTHHLHFFADGHEQIDRLLLFRDFLIAHGEDAKAYAELKQQLAARFPNDAPRYTDAKSEFVQKAGTRAVAWRDRLGGSGNAR